MPLRPTVRLSTAISLGLCLAAMALLSIRSADIEAATPQGTLAKLAASARARGDKTATTSSMMDEDGSHLPLEELARVHSVALVRPIAISFASTASKENIYTWSSVAVKEMLSTRPALPGVCNTVPPPTLPNRRSTAWLLAMYGGTFVIDGVAVTSRILNYPDLTLRLDRDYLLLAVSCPDRILLPTAGSFSLLEVDAKGRLIAPYGERRAFVDSLLGYETVAGVRRYLSTVANRRHDVAR